jgi:hypothetical protein
VAKSPASAPGCQPLPFIARWMSTATARTDRLPPVADAVSVLSETPTPLMPVPRWAFGATRGPCSPTRFRGVEFQAPLRLWWKTPQPRSTGRRQKNATSLARCRLRQSAPVELSDNTLPELSRLRSDQLLDQLQVGRVHERAPGSIQNETSACSPAAGRASLAEDG